MSYACNAQSDAEVRQVDIRQLRYFVGVVEAGSFTRAADRLHVAQSALSLHVRQMEERLGVRLLERERTGVHVTDAGGRLMAHAQIILRQMALAESELSSTALLLEGEVNVGIPPATARILVPRLLAAARERIPAVTVKISEGLTVPLQEWMAAGRLSLKLAYRTRSTLGRSIEIARESFCLIAPIDAERWHGRETVCLAELEGVPLAVPMPNNNVPGTVAEVVGRHRSQLNLAFELDSLSTIINMIVDRQACSILPASAIQQELRDGVLRAIPIVDRTIERSIVVATNVRDEADRTVIAVRAVLIDAVRELIESGIWPAILAGAPAPFPEQYSQA
jgi:LysR family transcriptional regulator, nitrogen assimilation regulatory protein